MKPKLEPCVVCGAKTDWLCSDCAIGNPEHNGTPVCCKSACREEHERIHQPQSIAELEALLNNEENEIRILPDGRIVSSPGSKDRPLTFRENLGGEYAQL